MCGCELYWSAVVRQVGLTFLASAAYCDHGMRELETQHACECRIEGEVRAAFEEEGGTATAADIRGSVAEATPSGRSRHLLLALVWVLSKFRVLQALLELQGPTSAPAKHAHVSVDTPLPPYPEVRSE